MPGSCTGAIDFTWPSRVTHAGDQPRLEALAALGEYRRHVRQLQRCHQQVALADPEVDRLAREPDLILPVA